MTEDISRHKHALRQKQHVLRSALHSMNYYYHPSSGSDYAEVDGNYCATCAWIFTCNARLWMDQFYDGPFDTGWYNI